jgi:hypothetical protein
VHGPRRLGKDMLRTFSLEKAGDAIAEIGGGHTRGKLVVSPCPVLRRAGSGRQFVWVSLVDALTVVRQRVDEP